MEFKINEKYREKQIRQRQARGHYTKFVFSHHASNDIKFLLRRITELRWSLRQEIKLSEELRQVMTAREGGHDWPIDRFCE